MTTSTETLAKTKVRSRRALALWNMAWLLGDKAFALVSGLAIAGLIGRHYGPAGSGHFAYASALLQTALGLSMVCAGVALLPRFCRAQARANPDGGQAQPAALAGAMANVFVLRMAASVLAMLAVMTFCWLTVEEVPRRNATLVMLLAVPLIEPFYVFATYWLSRNSNKPTVVARGSGLVLRLAVVLLALWLGAPLWVLAIAWVVEAALNATLQYAQARKAMPGLSFRRSVRPARMSRYLGFGVRFMVALWMMQIFLRLDRLVLAERLDAHDFGIYAAPMQLVEVWAQVAYLVGSSVASAYLYHHLDSRKRGRAFLMTAAVMVGIGLVGLIGAWKLGPWLLNLVYGAEFVDSHRYLVAGTAFAVLLFADQPVDMMIMANDQPGLLAYKWSIALSVAAVVMATGFAYLGALVGPVGLSAGILTAWLAVRWPPMRLRRRRQQRVAARQDGPEDFARAEPLHAMNK